MPVEQAPIGEGGVGVLHSRASVFRNAGAAKRQGPAYPESHQPVLLLFFPSENPEGPEALWPWWKLVLFLGLLGGIGYLAFG